MAVTVAPDVKTGLDPTRDQGGYSYRMFLQLATIVCFMKRFEKAGDFIDDKNENFTNYNKRII